MTREEKTVAIREEMQAVYGAEECVVLSLLGAGTLALHDEKLMKKLNDVRFRLAKRDVNIDAFLDE